MANYFLLSLGEYGPVSKQPGNLFSHLVRLNSDGGKRAATRQLKYYVPGIANHTIRGHGNSYTRHFVHTTSRTKTKTRHFVQKRNQTFRTKMKPDISCNLYYTTYYYNVVSYVHIPLVP